MPGAKLPEPEYVAARRVLLDAYEALGTHRKAVVLVGAQAIYLHVGEGDLAVTPYTTDGDRLQDKDGLDVLRLLRFAETVHLAGTLAKLAEHPIAGDVTRQARAFLQEHFGDRDGIGAQMAVRASVGLEDAAAIAISCEALARRLLDAWKWTMRFRLASQRLLGMVGSGTKP